MSEDEDKHPIFTKDPSEWMQYLYKEVCVVTDYKTEHIGWVFTVDPVSQSVALVKFEDGNAHIEVVLGDAVQSINVTNADKETHREALDRLFKPPEQKRFSSDELRTRRDQLKDWLLKNRIPVKEAGPTSQLLSISDALFIEPPYEPSNCRSTNEIILARIQGLIKNMPADTKTDN